MCFRRPGYAVLAPRPLLKDLAFAQTPRPVFPRMWRRRRERLRWQRWWWRRRDGPGISAEPGCTVLVAERVRCTGNQGSEKSAGTAAGIWQEAHDLISRLSARPAAGRSGRVQSQVHRRARFFQSSCVFEPRFLQILFPRLHNSAAQDKGRAEGEGPLRQ